MNLGDQTKIEHYLNEDDLKILNVEYPINHWSDLPYIFNLSRMDETKI